MDHGTGLPDAEIDLKQKKKKKNQIESTKTILKILWKIQTNVN